MKDINLKRGKGKANIQKRILRANIILILIPMIILAIIIFSGIGILGQTIGTGGSESLKNEGLKSLQTKSQDIANYVNNSFSQLSVDLERLVQYNEDLFDEKINITGTRVSYHQTGSPVTIYSDRYQKSINTSYSDYVNITTITPEMEELINSSAYMDYICESIYGSNSFYVDIYMVYEKNFSRVFPYINDSRPLDQNLTESAWYGFAKSLNGQIYYGVNQSLVGPSLLLAKAIYSKNNFIGCVAIKIELTSLRSLFNSTTIQETGYPILINENGEAIIHPLLGLDELNDSLTTLESNDAKFQAIVADILSGTVGIDNYVKNGIKMDIAYAPIGKGGFTVASIVPEVELTEAGASLINTIAATSAPMIIAFIVILSILIIVILFGVLRMSKRITSPITQLTTSIDNMVRGDLTKEIPLDKKNRKNEIGVLAQSFQALLITMRLGNQSYYEGDIYLAYKNYAAALKLFDTTKNIKGQGICWNNLGNIFRTWGEFEKAKEAYDKSIVIAKDVNDLAGLSSRLNNRALLYLSEGNWDNSFNDFNEAIRIDEEMGVKDRIAVRKRNIGVLYLLKGDHDISRQYLDEAFKMDQDLDIQTSLAEDHFQLGRLDYIQKRTDSAINHLESALKISQEFGNVPLMINVLKILIEIYDQQDNTVLLHKAEAQLAKLGDNIIRKKDVIFVIDQSGSMEEQNKMGAAKKGAREIFESVINPNDRIALIGFHSKIEYILPLTLKSGNVSNIQDVIKRLRHTPYQTMFYDALGTAIAMLQNSPPENQKWIVALTDGLDNCSSKYHPGTIAKLIKSLNYPLNIILIGVGKELREVYNEMNIIVSASIRGKYIPIYSEARVSKSIEEAFMRVKEIMASSEIEGFIPEEK